jgi:hypothetical protein
MYAPILKILNVEGRYNHNIYIDVKNPLYLPIITDCLNEIEISMRMSSGELIPFESGKAVLCLHFRKQNIK